MIRVLVVDDDVCMCDLVADLIADQIPARIRKANSGNVAIRLLEKGEKFDLIVSDYRMKDGNGADLMEFISQRQSSVLLILFTSITDVNPPHMIDGFLGTVEKSKPKKLIEKAMLGICTGGRVKF